MKLPNLSQDQSKDQFLLENPTLYLINIQNKFNLIIFKFMLTRIAGNHISELVIS